MEWLTDKHFGGIENCTPDFRVNIKQAIEIEKQQIELAFLTGKRNGIKLCQYNSKAKEIQSEEYYNETFKK